MRGGADPRRRFLEGGPEIEVLVIPAQAGIQVPSTTARDSWVPACAGMTPWGGGGLT